nr:antibiotic biosynthesis monooxygenase [Mammaliicoccus sp. Marseille-Q6498]
MFVAQATFSTKEPDAKPILDNKASNAVKDFEGFEGFIDAEVWKMETGSKLEYAIVSKWQDKKDFQAWISRPAHIEEHKNMSKEAKEKEEATYPKIEKQIKKYELMD